MDLFTLSHFEVLRPLHGKNEWPPVSLSVVIDWASQSCFDSRLGKLPTLECSDPRISIMSSAGTAELRSISHFPALFFLSWSAGSRCCR
jgi:hypothetical protein